MKKLNADQFRHDVRNKQNALKLAVTVLGISTSPQEALEWLDMVERAANQLSELFPHNDQSDAGSNYTIDLSDAASSGAWAQ